MASNLIAMASNLRAMASNLIAMASNIKNDGIKHMQSHYVVNTSSFNVALGLQDGDPSLLGHKTN